MNGGTVPMADPVSLFVLLAIMGVVPFAAMIVSSYTKIVVVLGLLRQAIGIQQTPSNMVISGIAIIVSAYIMAPVFMQAQQSLASGNAISSPGPTNAQQVLRAAESAREPLRTFLDKHADERHKQFFLHAAGQLWPAEQAARLERTDLMVLAPAFLVTELTAAFRIGFLLYLCFVVVDLVIANVLLAMGLQQVQPTNIAIPFKLLLFVVLDGWSKLIYGLVLSYR
jgi:type III secretion protein R